MDLTQIIAALRAEQEQLEEAILSLERVAGTRGKRRGRPPAWMMALEEAPAVKAPKKRRGRPLGSGKKRTEAAGE